MFFLSWRQLMARKKQTYLILLGISFGTLLYVSISGVQLGMRAYFSEQLLNNTAHVLIKGAERTVKVEDITQTFYSQELVHWVTPPAGLREEAQLESYSGWYQLLDNDPRVMDFAPRLSAHVVLSNGKFTSAISLVGTIPRRQIRISSIEHYMVMGSFASLQGSNNIVLGSQTVEDLGLKLGQYVNVSEGNGRNRSFRIVGVFHFGNQQVDRSMGFANLTDVQILTRKPGRVNEIAIGLYDIDQSMEVAEEWRMLGRDKVEDWTEANKAFMEMIKVQDFTRYFITIAILVVAAFGVYNVLSIMINQKKREIAILRAIGYGPPQILQLVLWQGVVLGIAGGVLGLLLGYGLCRIFGNLDLGIEIGGSNHLPMSYELSIYIIAFIAALGSALLAAYIPARAASRLSPMDIIRSES